MSVLVVAPFEWIGGDMPIHRSPLKASLSLGDLRLLSLAAGVDGVSATDRGMSEPENKHRKNSG